MRKYVAKPMLDSIIYGHYFSINRYENTPKMSENPLNSWQKLYW